MEDDIPTKILIETNDIVSYHLCTLYNKAINNQNYPSSLKLANVIHKKGEKKTHEKLSSSKSISNSIQIL